MTEPLNRDQFRPQVEHCEPCELRGQCWVKKAQAFCEIGSKYKPGGLMFIGEGPGNREVSEGRPFVGQSGQLLNHILQAAGIKRDECWVTNATLGLPLGVSDRTTRGGLHERYPQAIHSCLPRLEYEIEVAKPRVIVTLGGAALVAMAGSELVKTKNVKFDCPSCDEKRRVGPAIKCALGTCDWYEICPQGRDETGWAADLKGEHDGKCPKCQSSIARLRPRRIKCPACGGRKTRVEEFTSFTCDYKLLGKHGIAGAVLHANQQPGKLDEFGVRYIIPTYHPSYCLRSLKAKDLKFIGGQYAAHAMLMHFQKARELLTRDARFTAKPKPTKDPKEVAEWLKAPGIYAVDIETNSMDGAWCDDLKITCIGFARADREEALVVDTRHVPLWWHAQSAETAALLDAFQLFFESPKHHKVLHNGIFDRTVIRRLWGMDLISTRGDTLVEHNNIWPDEEHRLGFVAQELLDVPPWKDPKTKLGAGVRDDLSGYVSFDDLAQYNAIDTRTTALLHERFRGAGLDGEGLVNREGVPAALDIDMKMVDLALEMQWYGLPVSTKVREEIKLKAQGLCADHLEAMREIVGNDDFIPRGRKLLWALYNPEGPCKLVAPGYTPTGQPSTSKEDLAKLTKSKFVQHLLAWRKHDYHLSHYIESKKLVMAHDGRIHPVWKPWGARTGRWSSEPNFQNWPKYMRTMVIAPRRRKFVGADYSQLEMRIMAALSGDPELIRRCAEADESDKLNPEQDPHSFMAFKTFGKTYAEAFTQFKLDGDAAAKARCQQLRDITKRTVYGLNYGAGAGTVLDAIYDGGYEGPPLSITLINKVVQTYFATFPGVPAWRDAALNRAHELCEVTSPILGRHRVFPMGRIDATVVYNYPIQAGAADIMNLRAHEVHVGLRHVDPSAFPIAQVHDALYIECAEDRAQDVARFLEETLTIEMSIQEGAPSMPYVASAAISDNWKDAV